MGQLIILNYSYSYRKCDISNFGQNDDEFAHKLDILNTEFNYCYVWIILMKIGILKIKKEIVLQLLHISMCLLNNGNLLENLIMIVKSL